MKSSISCQFFGRSFQANLNWAEVLGRAAVVAALALVLPKAAAQSNVLVNPGMETGDFTGWTTYSAVNWDYAVANTNGGGHSNPCAAPATPCPNPDVALSLRRPVQPLPLRRLPGRQPIRWHVPGCNNRHGGGCVQRRWMALFLHQRFPRRNGQNQRWIEVTFRDATKNNILALYRSQLIVAAMPPTSFPRTPGWIFP